MRAPITSRKHYVQVSLSTVAASAILDIPIAKSVDLQSVVDPDDVQEGSIIKAVFIEMWVRGSETSPGSVLLTFGKRSGGDVAITTAEAAALDSYDNKKNIFYHTQGLANDQDADAIPFIRQWFKIPKGKQRMGLNDKLFLSVFAQGAISLVICGFMTYKEYT